MCTIRRTYRIFKHDAEQLERLFTNPSKAVRLLIAAYVQKNELPSSEQIGELIRLRTEVHRIGVNLNQIARRANTGESGFHSELTAQFQDLKAVIADIRKCLRGFDGS